MNKQQLVALAKRKLDERRFSAEDRAQDTLNKLRQNDQWNKLERELRQAQVDLAMGNGDGKKLQAQITQLTKAQQQLLNKLGLSVRDIAPQYSCAKCNDTGYVDGAICNCLQTEINKLIVEQSNVSNSDYTFANSREQDKHNLAVYKKAQQICRDGNTNILLVGNTGSGKTYLLTACANMCAELGKSVMFVTAYALNATLLGAHLSDVATNQAVLDSLVEIDVLAIDDLGTENVYKNVTAEYFFAVLNERIARKKQTFVSSNLKLTEIRDRYDERMFSRLVDRNTTFVAELIGDDKRVKKD